MTDDLGPRYPVLLEYHPKGDYWKAHLPQEVAQDKKEECQIVPYETAIRLDNIRRCMGCFSPNE